MILDEYLQYLQELIPGSKCRKATVTYRQRLAQLQRLNIDARMACEKLKGNPLASPGGYKECMDALKLRQAAGKGKAKNERLRMQRHCKKSVSAQLSGTKHAPEVSPDEDV
ncbi:MAG: hypothetical protein ACTSRU_12540 [Candidatus Hodarchaeales archaeon]